jgi:hypothetical protein
MATRAPLQDRSNTPVRARTTAARSKAVTDQENVVEDVKPRKGRATSKSKPVSDAENVAPNVKAPPPAVEDDAAEMLDTLRQRALSVLPKLAAVEKNTKRMARALQAVNEAKPYVGRAARVWEPMPMRRARSQVCPRGDCASLV